MSRRGEREHCDNEALVAAMTILALQAIPPILPKCWFSLGGRARDAEPTPNQRRSCALVIHRFPPEPLQNVGKNIVFFMPPSATAVAL